MRYRAVDTCRVDRRADRTLGFVESLPDAVRCRITQVACETAESLHFVAADRRLFEQCPQGIRRQEQSPDLVGQSNAKGSSTAGRPMTIATENAVSADRLVTLRSFVVATQNPMTPESNSAQPSTPHHTPQTTAESPVIEHYHHQ